MWNILRTLRCNFCLHGAVYVMACRLCFYCCCLRLKEKRVCIPWPSDCCLDTVSRKLNLVSLPNKVNSGYHSKVVTCPCTESLLPQFTIARGHWIFLHNVKRMADPLSLFCERNVILYSGKICFKSTTSVLHAGPAFPTLSLFSPSSRPHPSVSFQAIGRGDSGLVLVCKQVQEIGTEPFTPTADPCSESYPRMVCVIFNASSVLFELCNGGQIS